MSTAPQFSRCSKDARIRDGFHWEELNEKGRDGFCLVWFILKGSVYAMWLVCVGDSATGWEPESTILGASGGEGSQNLRKTASHLHVLVVVGL